MAESRWAIARAAEGKEKDASSSDISQSSASLLAPALAWDAWDGLRREALVALLIEPVRVRPEADEVDCARLNWPSSILLVDGEGMYDRLVRLPLRGVSGPDDDADEGTADDSGCETRFNGLGPVNDVLRLASCGVSERAGEAASFWSRLRRRGKVCREGVVVVVGVAADHSDWSICGVLKLDAAPAGWLVGGSMTKRNASQLACV